MSLLKQLMKHNDKQKCAWNQIWLCGFVQCISSISYSQQVEAILFSNSARWSVFAKHFIHYYPDSSVQPCHVQTTLFLTWYNLTDLFRISFWHSPILLQSFPWQTSSACWTENYEHLRKRMRKNKTFLLFIHTYLVMVIFIMCALFQRRHAGT